MSDRTPGRGRPSEMVPTSQFRVAANDLPRRLIPFAKLGPKGLPKLLGENLADLGEVASKMAGITSVRTEDGIPHMGFFDTPEGPQPGPYTVSNYTPSRTLDASTATLGEVADFLCTLIDDLKTLGVLGG